MTIQLSQKERMFLKDGKLEEEICIEKYKNYSEKAQDAELKQLLSKLSGEEQHHYDSINQMLQGQEPNLNHGQQEQQPVAQNKFEGTMNNESDKILCNDLLSTEKYVASAYNMDVFESANPVVRQTMQHIQQEEQGHGEQLFNYMNSHGMYNVE